MPLGLKKARATSKGRNSHLEDILGDTVNCYVGDLIVKS